VTDEDIARLIDLKRISVLTLVIAVMYPFMLGDGSLMVILSRAQAPPRSHSI